MMRKFILIVLTSLLSITAVPGQVNDSIKVVLPSVIVKDLQNKNINTAELTNKHKPLLLIFWKSCCMANINVLDAINEVYADWQEETGVVLYAVSVDDSRSAANIAPLVNGKGWDFPVLLDVNADFKRAMNVNATPHIFILNGDGVVVWQKMMYAPGDETEIHKVLLSIK